MTISTIVAPNSIAIPLSTLLNSGSFNTELGTIIRRPAALIETINPIVAHVIKLSVEIEIRDIGISKYPQYAASYAKTHKYASPVSDVIARASDNTNGPPLSARGAESLSPDLILSVQ